MIALRKQPGVSAPAVLRRRPIREGEEVRDIAWLTPRARK
ncbi:hypothetical protein I541_5701 [Mycobacteroides abscessus]|nr:hypothetical protein I541_5701 [Mycobacteroides abscessus]